MLSSLFPQGHRRFYALPVLGGVLDELCEWLASNGYPRSGLRRRVTVAPHLDRRLRSAGVQTLSELTASELLSFAPSSARWTSQITASLVRSLASYLTERGELALPPSTLTHQRVAEYERYLVDARGLATSTVERQRIRIGEFLRFLGCDEDPEKLRNLGAADFHAFLVSLGDRMGRASMQKVAAALRGFVRFLGARGEAAAGLADQIDAPRVHCDERLPRSLPWQTVRSLLASIDPSTVKGCRDYAMILLVATYGLRRGELPPLTLDHIDWGARTIRVDRPKVGSPLLLPLTDEVATALVNYLRHGRPTSSSRSLFLKVRAPSGPITGNVVGDAFDWWARLAGVRLPRRAGGPHCLRHSLAEHLLRQGASLKAIGDVLGHRSPESTCIYLRLKVEDLREAAVPLPTPATEERP
jgi:site-specific recombinase XerD